MSDNYEYYKTRMRILEPQLTSSALARTQYENLAKAKMKIEDRSRLLMVNQLINCCGFPNSWKTPKEIPKWKAITLTQKSKEKLNLEDIRLLVDKIFKTELFESYEYCVEHIDTNLHLHLAVKFKRQEWFDKKFRSWLTPKCPNFDVSHKDSKGYSHLKSKTTNQIQGWIKYINKVEDNKYIFGLNVN